MSPRKRLLATKTRTDLTVGPVSVVMLTIVMVSTIIALGFGSLAAAFYFSDYDVRNNIVGIDASSINVDTLLSGSDFIYPTNKPVIHFSGSYLDNKSNIKDRAYVKLNNSSIAGTVIKEGDVLAYEAYNPAHTGKGCGLALRLLKQQGAVNSLGYANDQNGIRAVNNNPRSQNGWFTRYFDLSPYVGRGIKEVDLVQFNQGDGSDKFECYYSDIRIEPSTDKGIIYMQDGIKNVHVYQSSGIESIPVKNGKYLIEFYGLYDADSNVQNDYAIYSYFGMEDDNYRGYKIESGDYLTYWSYNAIGPGCGIDISLKNISDERSANRIAAFKSKDQDGVFLVESNDNDNRNWYQRIVKLPESAVGREIKSILLVQPNDRSTGASFTCLYDDIKITKDVDYMIEAPLRPSCVEPDNVNNGFCYVDPSLLGYDCRLNHFDEEESNLTKCKSRSYPDDDAAFRVGLSNSSLPTTARDYTDIDEFIDFLERLLYPDADFQPWDIDGQPVAFNYTINEEGATILAYYMTESRDAGGVSVFVRESTKIREGESILIMFNRLKQKVENSLKEYMEYYPNQLNN